MSGAAPLPRTSAARAFAGAVAALALAGCLGDDGGEPLPPQWHGRDLRDDGWRNETIEAGWTLAYEYSWPSGQSFAWDWFTPQDKYLYFRVVRMQDGQAQPLMERHATEDKGKGLTPSAGTYMLVLINEDPARSQPIDVTVRPPEGGLRQTFPPGEGPGCLQFTRAACLDGPLPAPMRQEGL